jgi:hypothetical protein
LGTISNLFCQISPRRGRPLIGWFASEFIDAMASIFLFKKKEFIDTFVLLYFDCVKCNEVTLHLKSNVKKLIQKEVFSLTIEKLGRSVQSLVQSVFLKDKCSRSFWYF